MEKNNFLKFHTKQFVYDGLDYSLITYYLLLKSEECTVFWKDPLTKKIDFIIYDKETVYENIKNNDWILL